MHYVNLVAENGLSTGLRGAADHALSLDPAPLTPPPGLDTQRGHLAETSEQSDPDVALDRDFALIYNGLEDIDAMFRYLESAVERRLSAILWLRGDHRPNP